MNLDRLLAVTALVRREAIRRDAGEERDPRFDVPLSVLLDLADDLIPLSADVDVLLEELHAGRPAAGVGDVRAMLDDCTNDAACESAVHLSSCPRRDR